MSRFATLAAAEKEPLLPLVTVLPLENRLAELRRDYAAMEPMFLRPPMTFEEILAVLREAEQTLNRS